MLFRSLLQRLWLLVFLAFAAVTPTDANAQEMRAASPALVLGQPAPDAPAHWVTVPGNYIQMHGEPGSEKLLLSLARHGSESVITLSDKLGIPIGGTIHVYVASSRSEFFSLQPGRVPEYADGTAWPSMGAIFLKRPRIRGAGQRPLTQVLDHELVHVMLGRVYAPNHPPRWLQEGIAQVTAGEYDPSDVHTIVRGQALGSEVSLRSLSVGFPDDPRRADVAYAQSADFINFIQSEYGEDRLPVLIRELANGNNIDRAIRRTTGEFFEDVEAKWRQRFGPALPVWISLAASFDTWWTLAAVIAFFSLILANRRLRKRMKEYAEAEKRQDEIIASLLGLPPGERLPYHFSSKPPGGRSES